MQNMKTRASRIIYLRTLLGVNQEGLAELMGVKRGAVGNWELNKGIGRNNLAKLAALTGATIDWIERGTGDRPTTRPGAISPSSQPTATHPHPYTRDELLAAIAFALFGLVPGMSEAEASLFARTVLEALEAPPSRIQEIGKLDKARMRIEDEIERFSEKATRRNQPDH